MKPADPQLREFVERALEKGASDRFLADLLKSNGWSDKEIYAAFREHYEKAIGQPLPQRYEAGEGARDAFLYLLIFSTLATWTIAAASMLFRLIDLWFPDRVALRGSLAYPHARLDLSFQLACILVAFPVFVLVTRKAFRTPGGQERQRLSDERKWLTYLALVIAAGVLIGDAVTVLAYFLQGEISLRFIFKVLVVAALAAGVFTFYLGEVSSGPSIARRRSFALMTCAAVLAVIVTGFTATGGPASQRALQADHQRLRDLHHIAESVRNGILNGASSLPANLTAVPAAGGFSPRLRDPETSQLYEYKPGAGTSYELCASFTTEDRGDVNRGAPDFWAHGAGPHCFALDAKRPTPALLH